MFPEDAQRRGGKPKDTSPYIKAREKVHGEKKNCILGELIRELYAHKTENRVPRSRRAYAMIITFAPSDDLRTRCRRCWCSVFSHKSEVEDLLLEGSWVRDPFVLYPREYQGMRK